MCYRGKTWSAPPAQAAPPANENELESLISTSGSSSTGTADSGFPGGSGGTASIVNNIVMVLAATNHPWDIDDAFRRRFEKRILINLPDLEARKSLLKISLKDVALDEGVDLNAVAEGLANFSGADITAFCRDAALMSMRKMVKGKSPAEIKEILANRTEDIGNKPVTMEDFNEAMERSTSSVQEADVKKHQAWIKRHGSH